MELFQVIREFILYAAGLVVASLLVGGGLGILFAWLFRLLFRAVPGLRPPLMLLPWRTILFGGVFFSISSMYGLLTLSPSNRYLFTLIPALVFLLLVFSFAGEKMLNYWLSAGKGVKLAGLARTLAGAAVLFAAIWSGIEFSIRLAYSPGGLVLQNTQEPGNWTTLGVVMGLAWIFDLLLGIVQMLFAYRDKRKAAKIPTPVAAG